MKCFNRNVLFGLAAAVLAVFLFAPSVASAAIPLLVVLACPLSMVVMMRGMSGGQRRRDEAATNARQTATVNSAESEIARAPRPGTFDAEDDDDSRPPHDDRDVAQQRRTHQGEGDARTVKTATRD